MSDDEFFQEEMLGVTPLKRDARERLLRKVNEGDGEARRLAAEGEPEGPLNSLVDEGVEPLDAWYVLAFKRPGIQHGVYKKLRQGRYEIDARLDLHRLSVKQARMDVHSFIQDAMQYGLRTVLILHGKGQRKTEQEKTAVLKGYVQHWLQELEEVQAFHSAQPVHGGTGAVYVLLRKSLQKKRENRERFLKGRVPYDRPAD
ncbi:MAG: DNA endonuclease SmrA [Luminiphilus sp.]|nr:DNA endonuclease SmrA [Halieaceae bacterium]MDG1493594.1 DNA endonuclease SmrA [Luminiphilus sp.]MBT6263187.1 DNA endonuclease SmrA [Halieaceae bacterium]MBT7341386.1 DNA endonuclease SmrA [Halieaceae bacterium]MDG1828484.1 DNA endonuclease SmrA [Luminiphilus sp.]